MTHGESVEECIEDLRTQEVQLSRNRWHQAPIPRRLPAPRPAPHPLPTSARDVVVFAYPADVKAGEAVRLGCQRP